LKAEFVKVLELVKSLSNVLDVDMPEFVIEEVKSQT